VIELTFGTVIVRKCGQKTELYATFVSDFSPILFLSSYKSRLSTKRIFQLRKDPNAMPSSIELAYISGNAVSHPQFFPAQNNQS